MFLVFLSKLGINPLDCRNPSIHSVFLHPLDLLLLVAVGFSKSRSANPDLVRIESVLECS